MSNLAFTTPELPGNAELIIKKSRFIGHIFPVKCTEEAERTLEDVRIQHKTANHNCFAYRVGLGVPVERFSDDGEPSGTAGRPILEVLRRKSIDNILVVVTRYFGGTLLGAGGLVHAYTDATVAAIDAVPLLECREMQRIDIGCDYRVYGKLEYELANRGYEMLDKAFTDRVQFHVWCRIEDVQSLVELLAEWSNGQAVSDLSRPEYVGCKPDGQFVFGVWPE